MKAVVFLVALVLLVGSIKAADEPETEDASAGETTEDPQFNQADAISDEQKKQYVDESFTAMDANKDGFLVADEMVDFMTDGIFRMSLIDSTQQFDHWDLNKDGFIEWSEISTGQFMASVAELEQAMTNGSFSKRDFSVINHSKDKFAICDKNQDGKLSRNEHYYYLNANSLLAAYEMESTWLEYDQNRDGKVEFLEMHNADYSPADIPEDEHKKPDRRFFDTRDFNGDGVLEYSEIKAFFHPNRAEQALDHIHYLFLNLDVNKDELLSREEADKGRDEIVLFQGTAHEIPAETADDVPGPPTPPPSRIDYKLFSADQKTAHEEL